MKRIRMTGKITKQNGRRHVDLKFANAPVPNPEAKHYVAAFVPKGEGACGILKPTKTTTILIETTCATCVAAVEMKEQIETCAQAYRVIGLMPLEVRSLAQSVVARERAALIEEESEPR